MREKLDGWPVWLRWALAVPAGVVAGLLVTFPIHWVVIIGTSGSSEDDGGPGMWDLPPETLERSAYALFVPMTIIFVASQVAPAHRVYLAGILAVAWSLLLGVSLTIAAQSGNYADMSDWIEFAAVVILGVGGSLAGLFNVYREEESS